VDRRNVVLLSQADAFEITEIPDQQTKIFNLAGLFRGEIPPEMIEPLSSTLYYLSQGGFSRIRGHHRQCRSAAGRGDTCFVSYMVRRLNHGIEQPLR